MVEIILIKIYLSIRTNFGLLRLFTLKTGGLTRKNKKKLLSR